MSYPSVRQQDEFFAGIGVDPMTTPVEVVTIHDYKHNAMTVMYQFERDGQTFLAIHWPETR